ncbi:MAG: Periplasmic chelated iron-binding protein YfeA [Gemmatimonadaceae bacterium]|nr:Periplasmic chelated iron-binding protein YfeA [Gemmatimonadaceae bacterium]
MLTFLLMLIAAAGQVDRPVAPVRVVTSLTTYGAIAREVAGDRATVTSIAEGDEDPHFVQPRPSFVPLLRDADLFVTTGMDLELWVPALLDRAGNGKVREGGPGYVAAFKGIPLLDVPTSLSRAQGDIHVDGNPHIHTDPINAIIIARNILDGLKRVSPANAEFFAAREKDFEDRLLKATFGDEIVRIVTPATLFELARSNKVMAFLQNPYQGRPLQARLGGWMGQAMPFRGKDMVCYHKEWAYFSRRYGVNCVEFIEAKPGIPPTPRHVQEVIALMRDRKIPVLFASNYFDRNQVKDVAARTGAAAVIVPENTHGAPGVETYFDLMNAWITALGNGFRAAVSK